MAIYNTIFGEYRENQKKIESAIKLLQDNDYVILSKEDYKSIKKTPKEQPHEQEWTTKDTL